MILSRGGEGRRELRRKVRQGCRGRHRKRISGRGLRVGTASWLEEVMLMGREV